MIVAPEKIDLSWKLTEINRDMGLFIFNERKMRVPTPHFL